MTSIVTYANSTNDDAQEWGNGTLNVDYTYLDVQIYTSTSSASYRCSGLRFQLNIPQGATINSAVPSIHTTSVASSYSPDLRIYAHDSDNAADFSTTPYVISEVQRPRTTAYVTWNGGTTLSANDWNNGPDISTVIQEIVNRPGWSSGNYIVILFIADSDATGKRLVFEGNEGGGNAAYLTIDYTEVVVDPGYSSNPAEGGTINFGAVTQGVNDTASLVITNTGGAALSVSTAAFSQRCANEFSISGIPMYLAPSAAGTATLTHRALNTGTRLARLTVTTNDPANGTVLYELTSTASVSSLAVDSSGVTFQYLIDWDRNGDFTDAIDDITPYVTQANWNLGMRQPYQVIGDEMRCEIEVRNDDRRFSPEYASGSLYGKLVPQRPILIQAVSVDGTATMWRGWLEGIAVDPLFFGTNKATLHGVGPKAFLEAAPIKCQLYENTTADQPIQGIMQGVILPPALTHAWVLGIEGYSNLGQSTYLTSPGVLFDFDTGKTTFSYVGDTWDTATTSYDALESLVTSERGKFFINREGRAVFWNRHHTLEHVGVDGTINDIMQGAAYAYASRFANDIRATCNPRVLDSGTTILWQLDAPLTVPAGETKTVSGQYTTQDANADVAGYDVQTPNTGDSTLICDSGAVTVVMDASARAADLSLTNSGAADVTVSTLIVKGRALTSWNALEVSATDGSAISFYGRRTEALNTDLLDSEQAALYVANYELSKRKLPVGLIESVTLMSKNIDAQERQLNYTLGHRLRVQETQTGHDREYFVVGEEHRTTGDGLTHETTWTMEPADVVQYWALGVAGASELGTTTRLTY